MYRGRWNRFPVDGQGEPEQVESGLRITIEGLDAKPIAGLRSVQSEADRIVPPLCDRTRQVPGVHDEEQAQSSARNKKPRRSQSRRNGGAGTEKRPMARTKRSVRKKVDESELRMNGVDRRSVTIQAPLLT